jgi:hypothetical protein
VKTRIARELGDGFALRLYRAMIEDLFANLRPLEDILAPFCDVPAGLPPVLPGVPGLERVRLQRGADLGERMLLALAQVFGEGAGRAVLIGSDTPHIRPEAIRSCLDALRSHDAALGPAADGGYYLVGFRRGGLEPRAFRDVPWGGPEVLEETVRRLGSRSLYLGEELRDIDRVEDLAAVLESQDAKAGLPRMRAVAEELAMKERGARDGRV